MIDRLDGSGNFEDPPCLEESWYRMARGKRVGIATGRNVVCSQLTAWHARFALCKQIASSRERETASHDDGRPSTKLDQAIEALTHLVACRHVINSLAALSERAI